MNKNNFNIYSAILHAAGLLFRLIFMLALIKYSTPEVLGYYSVAVGIEAVAIYLSGFEFHTFTSRRYAKRPCDQRLKLLINVHKNVTYASAVLSIVITIVLVFVFEINNSASEVYYIILIVLFGVFIQEIGRYLVLLGKSFYSIFLGFIRTAAWQPILLGLFFGKQLGFKEILVAWSSFSGVAFLVGVFLVKNYLTFRGKINFNYIKIGLSSSKMYYFISVATIIQGNIEKFVLQLMLGPAVVGIFSFYQTVSGTLMAVMQASTLNVLMPQILFSFGQNNKDRFVNLKKSIINLIKYGFLIALLIVCAVYPAIHFMNKISYYSYMWILPVLLLAQYLIVCTQPLHLAMYAKRFDSILVFLVGGGLLFGLFLDVVLVKNYGLLGVVYAPLMVAILLSASRVFAFFKLKKRGLL